MLKNGQSVLDMFSMQVWLLILQPMLLRPIPFAPLTEKFSLSATNYGSIPRFFVKTLEDFAISVSLQEAMIDSNTPQQVIQMEGSDHSPFLSKPQALHKILLEVSKVPVN
uniref:Avr9/Cf-9 rapidly elicited protein 246 n=1 Tax=Solanum tuberosum TaxID=4113 RepID=M1DW64_SOLTU